MFLKKYFLEIFFFKNGDKIKDANNQMTIIITITTYWSVLQTVLNTTSEWLLG